jgi:hypothetical protein
MKPRNLLPPYIHEVTRRNPFVSFVLIVVKDVMRLLDSDYGKIIGEMQKHGDTSGVDSLCFAVFNSHHVVRGQAARTAVPFPIMEVIAKVPPESSARSRIPLMPSPRE